MPTRRTGSFLRWTEWFIAHAHYVAAVGLFVCILIVVLANATRVDQTSFQRN